MKTAIIPVEIRKKPYLRRQKISVSSLLIDASADSRAKIDDFFATFFAHSNSIIVLCEDRIYETIKHLGVSMFIYKFDYALQGKNLQNFLSLTCTKVIKAFSLYAQRFDDQKNRKLLVLPLRNFRACEIAQLSAFFINGVEVDALKNGLEAVLSRLRKRQQPKVETSSKATYIVDDGGRFFAYAHERHSQVETGCPPHLSSCRAESLFRFGKRYDEARHFNVSRPGEDISGSFVDCHGVSRHVPQRTHLNMFPNDFFGEN